MQESLLQYVDKIQEQTTLSELSVINDLLNAYSKSVVILQEADESSDLSSFDIFQEGKIFNDLNAPLKGQYGESKIKKILMFIPRLIMKFMRIIVKLISTMLNLTAGIYDPDILDSELFRESLPIDYDEFDNFIGTLYINLRYMELDEQPTPAQFLTYFSTMSEKTGDLKNALDKYRENKEGFNAIFTARTYPGNEKHRLARVIQRGKENLKSCMKIAENVTYQANEMQKDAGEFLKKAPMEQDVDIDEYLKQKTDSINNDAMIVSVNLSQITQIISKITEKYMSVFKHGEADDNRAEV